jgi:hypothetical protein
MANLWAEFRVLRGVMPKSTTTYLNALSPDHQHQWKPIEGIEDVAEELTLSIDAVSGEYTRLTRFHPAYGSKSHDYPEEVFIVSGRLYDQSFDMWLENGYYASRSPGEVHGPFKTDIGCLVLEVSFPNRTHDNE